MFWHLIVPLIGALIGAPASHQNISELPTFRITLGYVYVVQYSCKNVITNDGSELKHLRYFYCTEEFCHVRPSVCLSVPTLSDQTISRILVKFGAVLYRNPLNKQNFRSHRLNDSCVLQILVADSGVAEASGPHHLLEDPKPQPYLHEGRKWPYIRAFRWYWSIWIEFGKQNVHLIQWSRCELRKKIRYTKATLRVRGVNEIFIVFYTSFVGLSATASQRMYMTLR
jgi:hypothetical protein